MVIVRNERLLGSLVEQLDKHRQTNAIRPIITRFFIKITKNNNFAHKITAFFEYMQIFLYFYVYLVLFYS